ncbi:MAG TPA: polymer-forming cytoskeletal protein [Candidatus Thermoplasmatota archaeon]|jgi:hypothetical protein|nr:polymer-forming cytoskeletal protein [Candidatus Thermoplasmatota archaeon]
MDRGRLAAAKERVHYFFFPIGPPPPRAAPRPRAEPRPWPRPLAALPPPAPRPSDEVLIDVPTQHADALIEALRSTGWAAEDTGLTVTTEDGEDHLTTIRLRPQAAVARDAPLVQGALYSGGDLVIGAGLQIEGAVFAEGSVTISRDATVLGTVAAGGDLILEEGAVAGDVFAGGKLRVAKTARTNAVVARRGTRPVDGPGP